jgi:small nuclear ribonucleoprotein (snRNP)-like protein
MDSENDAVYLPGAAALIEQIDARIVIVLRDGRYLEGTLRSFDQYMNIVLDGTVERISSDGMVMRLILCVCSIVR